MRIEREFVHFFTKCIKKCLSKKSKLWSFNRKKAKHQIETNLQVITGLDDLISITC